MTQRGGGGGERRRCDVIEVDDQPLEAAALAPVHTTVDRAAVARVRCGWVPRGREAGALLNDWGGKVFLAHVGVAFSNLEPFLDDNASKLAKL